MDSTKRLAGSRCFSYWSSWSFKTTTCNAVFGEFVEKFLKRSPVANGICMPVPVFKWFKVEDIAIKSTLLMRLKMGFVFTLIIH